MTPLPGRPGSTPNRTVWVEVDSDELEEVRIALVIRIEDVGAWGEEYDAKEVAAEQARRLRAVLDRLPTPAAMRRHYP